VASKERVCVYEQEKGHCCSYITNNLAMDRARRAMPIGNKQCYARHVKAHQDKHKAHLATIKPSIDNRAPQRFAHLQKNMKKEQMMEERYAEIERDNRYLLEKMSHIMRHSGNEHQNESMQYSKSLTKEYRKREMKRITGENQEILQRIQNAEPTYDHMAWEEDARRHEGYKKNICELPMVTGPLAVAAEAAQSVRETQMGGRGAAEQLGYN